MKLKNLRSGSVFFFDEFDVGTADFREEFFGLVRAELAIAGLDGDEKSIIGGAMELAAGKERVVQARKLNQGQQSKQYREA